MGRRGERTCRHAGPPTGDVSGHWQMMGLWGDRSKRLVIPRCSGGAHLWGAGRGEGGVEAAFRTWGWSTTARIGTTVRLSTALSRR